MAKPYTYPTEGFLTVAQYAKKRKVSAVTMHDYIKRGKLEGCYFKDQRTYVNIDEAKADAALSEPSIREQNNIKSMRESEDDKPIQAAHSYTKARTGVEIVKLQKAQIELAELKGSLIDVEKVKRETFIMARSLRDQLLSIPDRNSAIFAAEKDERKIHRMLLDEIRGALKATEEIIKKEIPNE